MLKKTLETVVDRVGEAEWNEFLRTLAERWSGEKGQRKQDRSKRREQEILRAALRVFARDGISRARIGDIAAEAGMPVSSLYEYFPSKEDLAYAVPITHLSQLIDEYARSLDEQMTARERLRMFLWQTADFSRRNPEWARTFYLEIWPSVLVSETPVRHAIDDYMRLVVRLIRLGELNGEWPEGPDRYESASILIGSMNHTLTTWLIYRKPRELMKSISSVIERTLSLLN